MISQLITPPPLALTGAATPRPAGAIPLRWMSPPAAGETCPFTGLKRGTFIAKLLGEFGDALVQVSIRADNATRGMRLVWQPSIHALLTALASGRDGAVQDLAINRYTDAEQAPVPAVWQRVPPNGAKCQFCGLGHSTYYQLLDRAGKDIAVVQLRAPGESRASRLVCLPSLHSHLVRLAREQDRKI